MLTERGGSEWSDDGRSAEWRRVNGSTSRARYGGRAPLRHEGEAGTGLWRSGGIGRVEGRRQETDDIIEISLIIDTGEPGLIGGARMRERDGDDGQKGQQRDAQAAETRSVRAIENSHSRLVRDRSVIGWAGHYRVGEIRRQDD